LQDTDDVVVVRILQHLKLQSEFIGLFCVESHHRSVGLSVGCDDFVTKPVGYPKVLQDIADGVVNVSHCGYLVWVAHIKSVLSSMRGDLEKSEFTTLVLFILFKVIFTFVVFVPLAYVAFVGFKAWLIFMNADLS
jgi:DNA-binding response OmpR family regulator